MAVDAGQVLAEEVIGRVGRVGHVVDDDHAAAHLHRRLDGVGQAGARGGGFVAVGIVVVAHHQPIHDDLDGVRLVALQRDLFADIQHLAVDAGADEARLADVFQHLLMTPFAVFDDRGQDLHARAVRPVLNRLDDLLGGLGDDFLAADGAVRHADARVEQAQVVVNLGDGAHRRARVVADALLVNGNGGRQPLDLVHVRLFHLAEELPGIGRERLDVAALALGEDGVESQRAFAAAAEAGDHDQLVAGDHHVNVLQVVLARAAHNDLVLGHGMGQSSALCLRTTDTGERSSRCRAPERGVRRTA